MGYCSKFWVTKFGIIKFQNNSMSYGLCKLLYLSWGGIRRIAPQPQFLVKSRDVVLR